MQDIQFEELKVLMQPEYNALQIFLGPQDFGHAGVKRKRSFIFFWHQRRCQQLDISSNINVSYCFIVFFIGFWCFYDVFPCFPDFPMFRKLWYTKTIGESWWILMYVGIQWYTMIYISYHMTFVSYPCIRVLGNKAQYTSESGLDMFI